MASVATISGKTVDDASSITHSIATTAGNLLIAVCGSKDSTTHTLTVSDSDWESVTTLSNGFPIDGAFGVWKLKAATTATTESLTVSSSTTSNVLSLHLIEVSGANAISEVDTKGLFGGVSTYQLDDVTTPSDSCLVIGSVFIAGRNPAVPTGYSEHLETTNSELTPVYLLTGSKTYASAGATGDIIGSLSGSGDSAYYSVHMALNSVTGGGTDYGDIFRDHAF